MTFSQMLVHKHRETKFEMSKTMKDYSLEFHSLTLESLWQLMTENPGNEVPYGGLLFVIVCKNFDKSTLTSLRSMKATWNSSSVTPNPLPSKITVRKANAAICKAAML